MNAIDKLTKARTALILEQPFFGALALRLKLEEVSYLDTMGVDGVSLFYNTSFVDELSMPQLKGVLAHEVMHCALGHPWRRGFRDTDQWNDAGDYVINGELDKAGFTLPDGGLQNPDFDNMATESVYERIGKQPENGGDDQQDGQSTNTDDDTNGQPGESGDGNDREGDDTNGPQQQTPDGRPLPSDSGGCGCVIDAPAPEGKETPSPADYREQEQEWKTAVAQAAQAARAAGELPGNLDRLVKEELAPKADWRALLREFIEQTARDDYAWNPPNRRYIHQGLYLPSVRSEKVPPIVVAIDTSGSITDDVLAQFQGELNAILEDVSPEVVNIVYCDSKVNDTQEVEPDDFPIELNACGGGGTRFQPVFDWVEENDIEPACLIYLTDMWNFDKPADPGCPVLWADYDGSREDEPEFGERIVIE